MSVQEEQILGYLARITAALEKIAIGRPAPVFPHVKQPAKHPPLGAAPLSPGRSSIKFVKPTLLEVAAYCTERKNNVVPQKFLDYYDSVGWVVGAAKKPMKDWKAAIRNVWEKNNTSGSLFSADNQEGRL